MDQILSVDGKHRHAPLYMLSNDIESTIVPTDRGTFCRFRMRIELFNRITHTLQSEYKYFKQLPDAVGKLGCTPRQKVTAAMRMLAYGDPADRVDSEVRMGASTIIESLKLFTRAIFDTYGKQYLRRPTREDIDRLLEHSKSRGFPGMIGSIDCMHWKWDKCPTGWAGQYTGHCRAPTVILEAVAGPDLWVWHNFFGLPGALNDINVLHRSPVFDDLSSGKAPAVHFDVNGTQYDMAYYLADGIYPDWATLIQGIQAPLSEKQKYFTKKQAEYRKDVERAFGVLQARYAICKKPARMWNTEDLYYIMQCCIILHNMTVEDESDLPPAQWHDYDEAEDPNLDPNRNVPEIIDLMAKHHQIRSRPGHDQLRADLIEHVWQHRSRSARNEVRLPPG
jgi:hypothetical protein